MRVVMFGGVLGVIVGFIICLSSLVSLVFPEVLSGAVLMKYVLVPGLMILFVVFLVVMAVSLWCSMTPEYLKNWWIPPVVEGSEKTGEDNK